jgi:dihydroflavonol-4-reductase
VTGPARPLRRAVVTGATGLLGSNIVRHLLADGTEVVAVVRDEERARRLLPVGDGLRLVTGDVTRVETVRPALAGADAVFHAAAYFREFYRPGADLDLLHRTNVTAVIDLLAAAVDAGVPVVVHTGSVGSLAPGRPADERTALKDADTPNAYFASKVRAEQAVREFVGRTGLRVPVVLPGWMWGPGDAGPTSSGGLFLQVARGQLAAVPDAGNYVVDARDVAEACVRVAAGGPAVAAERYLVAGVRRGLPSVCGQVAATLGVRPPRAVPARAALAAVTAMEAAARLRRRQPHATRRSVRVLIEADRRRLSSALAERELGVRFRPLADTVQAEAEWFARHGLLPASALAVAG